MSRLPHPNPPQRNIPPEFQQVHRQAMPQFPPANPHPNPPQRNIPPEFQQVHRQATPQFPPANPHPNPPQRNIPPEFQQVHRQAMPQFPPANPHPNPPQRNIPPEFQQVHRQAMPQIPPANPHPNPPQRNIPPEFQQVHRQATPQFPPANPPKVQEEPVTLFYPKAGRLLCFSNFFRNLFYLHFFLIAVLTSFLGVRGLLSHHHRDSRLLKLLTPLLSSTALAALVAFSCQLFTLRYPSTTLKAAFWLSPLLTCAFGILLVSGGSGPGLAVASLALVSAILMSLYSCWISPQFDYAGRVLSVSMLPPPPRTALIVFLTIIGGSLYSGVFAVGIGCATAAPIWGGLDKVFVLVMLLSYVWTMNVVKNVVGVVIARVKYVRFASGTELETGMAFRDVRNHSMGSVCVGSVLVPILGLVRSSARAMRTASGETDEFMFSCVDCYSGVASKLVSHANGWGFVHVGVYNKRFVQASFDTWEMFRRVGLQPLIESDLTSSFCFHCGVAGGGVCALAGGTWSRVVHNGYDAEVPIYAFLIGYFMCRVAMAWPQACVSAYHVAYAENPDSAQFDATIPVRIQELLHRSQAQTSQVIHDSTELEEHSATEATFVP